MTIQQEMEPHYYFTSIFQYPVLCEPDALCKYLCNKELQSIKHLWKWHRFLMLFPLTFCSYCIFRHLIMFLPSSLRDFDKHWHGQDWDKVTKCKALFETSFFFLRIAITDELYKNLCRRKKIVCGESKAIFPVVNLFLMSTLYKTNKINMQTE